MDGRLLCLGTQQLLFAPSGDLDAEQEGASGWYAFDTRWLSRLRCTPERVHLLDTHLQIDVAAAEALVVSFGRTRPESPERVDFVLQRRFRLKAPAALSLEIAALNASPNPLEETLHLAIRADFSDIFEVRSRVETWAARLPPQERPIAYEPAQGGCRWHYEGLDGVRRTLRLRWAPEPARVSIQNDGRLEVVYALNLRPFERAVYRLEFELKMERQAHRDLSPTLALVLLDADRKLPGPLDGGLPGVEPTGEPRLRRLLRRSLADLRSLLVPTGDGWVPVAGVPWYQALFGRDALITALMLLPDAPEPAQSALHALARFQGRREDPETQEEPGKIPHELRWGELAGAGRVPFGRYYGSIDATPLWLWLLGALYAQKNDPALAHKLKVPFERALAWLEERLVRDGYLFYDQRPPGRSSRVGLVNVGWKDSANAIVDERGQVVQNERVALCEVQGYAYAALHAGARILDALGQAERAQALKEQAERLKERFHRDFWLPEEGTFALALLGDGTPLRSVASNAGQCLLTGIVKPACARKLAQRLLQGDLFSGFGVRTLSAHNPAYSPVSYHCGSVWPHDTALIAWGLAECGLSAEARELAESLLDAAEAFGHRLPELFCGFPREETLKPVPYPSACLPAAWAAGAAFVIARILSP